MSDSENKGAEDGATAPIHDASLRVDPRSLSSEEQEFARMMGFSDEEPTAEAAAAKPPARKATSSAAPAKRAPEAEAPTDGAPETAAAEPSESPTPLSAQPASEGDREESLDAAPTSDAPIPPETVPEAPPAPARDFEEIHPRAASLGRQSALIEHADRVASLEAAPEAAKPGAHAAASSAPDAEGASAPSEGIDVAALRARLAASEHRIAELEAEARSLAAAPADADREIEMPASAPGVEKEVDALQREVEGLLQERDRLGDALAAANTARSEAQARAERLDAALRAARGPSGPVPDGERALRAEVIGLRRRLEASGDEARRLREALDERATELAIAEAHRDDRQNEIDQHRARIESLEHERAKTIERLDEALARQRELLALASRVQAENAELRSTQSALEETLEARDLEISAREEHLAVTRRGLATRDEQLLDAQERLEQARHRHELLEAELERARLAQNELEQTIGRRDARIASLSATLSRIEDAIGRPVARKATESAEISTAPEVEAAITAEPATPQAPESGSEAAAESEAESESESEPSPERDDAIEWERPAALPPAFCAWRSEKLRGLLGAETDLAGFLARRLVDGFQPAIPDPIRILSLGGSSLEAEIEFARALAALGVAGVAGVAIDVVEADDASLQARREVVEAAELASTITIRRGDELVAEPAEPYHALLFCDALFARATPGAVVDLLADRLAADGVVLFSDRIAGGALTISDETREKLAELWQVLPEAWTDQPAFANAPSAGDDGGVAAPQTDLPAVLGERFRPLVTLGFGHLADLALGPARGALVSELGAAAEAFLTSIDAIDESRSIAESLPPRHGVAVWIRREAAGGEADAAPERLGAPWPDSASGR
ncbi:MAG: hypothetical protein R3F21_06950 [Myxococcota bacterium]